MKVNAPVKRLSVGRVSTFIYREEDQDKSGEDRIPSDGGRFAPRPTPPAEPPKPVVKPPAPVLQAPPPPKEEARSPFFGFWVALLLTILYLPLIYVYLMYEVVKTHDFSFRKFDEGLLSTVHFILALLSLAAVALVYVAVSFRPHYARHRIGQAVFLTLAGSFIALAFFQLNPHSNSLPFLEKNRPILTFFASLFVSSLFLSIWALFARDFGFKVLPVIGAALLQMFMMDEVQLVLREYKYSVVQFGAWVIFTALLTAYFVWDLEYLCRRKDLYESGDHVVALVHIQTDLFYRFWIDASTAWKRKPVSAEGDAGVVEMG